MAITTEDDCGAYIVEREGDEITLHINFENCPTYPSIEDTPQTMALIIETLAETGPVTRIVFAQKRDYEYEGSQAIILSELGQVYKKLLQQKSGAEILSDQKAQKYISRQYSDYEAIIHRQYKEDPLLAYAELSGLKELLEEILFTVPPEAQKGAKQLLKLIDITLSILSETALFITLKTVMNEYKPGDRTLYRRIFSPNIKPDFMFTKLQAAYPSSGEEMDAYTTGGSDIVIFSIADSVQYLYHIIPPEFQLTEDKYSLLDAARKIISEHQPKRSEFTDPQNIRRIFTNVGNDLIEELASYKRIHLREKEKQQLVEILVRYTIGFGLIELLLQDEKIQDISVNSPLGKTPVFIVHEEYGDCVTNIIPTNAEAESWASKLRLISGRPLDEANPILDTELILPTARARVAVITAPLNSTGIAYSFRRHRDKPWTVPLFIQNKMLNPLAAGLLSFIIDGARTILVAGTRSAGKSSLLGSLLVEIMRRVRIITIEDTLELPVDALRALNYNIQSLKVASALTKGTTEVSADEGIRTTLRMGDSSLIVGEVRSTEALALYEAMRVGALANVVAGTIHGDSPYGVFDRVVNDLKVPRTSFKATDIIIVTNPVRSPDGLHRWRRITQITEVRKQWENDPILEGGFVDLMKYNAQTDTLEPTSELLNGDSEILKSIASNVKEWAGNWDAVWDNILLRAKIKETIVTLAKEFNDSNILEAPFVAESNDMFHRISESVREQAGMLDSKRILEEWNDWARKTVQKQHEPIV